MVWDGASGCWAGRLALLLLASTGAGLYISACGTTPATISWEDTSDNEEGFRIYRITGDHKTVIAEVGPNVTRYIDREAPSGACYVVTAFNAAGESTPTASACRGK